MKITPAILCAFLFLAAGHAFAETLSQADATELFEEGKSLFRQANSMADENPHESRQLMQKALLRFQRLVDEGDIRNGRLYYNLGNIHFHLDDLGQAILNYRRALEYIPDDVNLQQNLAYARSQREDAFAEPEQQKILKTLFFWHYDFTLRTRSMLFIAAFLATWTLLAIRLFSRSAWLTRVIVAVGALTLLLLVSVVLTQIHQRRSNPGVIVEREVVARLSDSENATPAFSDPLHAGTEFEMVEDRGNWCQVRLSDGQTCWLPADAIGLVH